MTYYERLEQIIEKTPSDRGHIGTPLQKDLCKPFRVDDLLVCADQHAMAAFVTDEPSSHVTREGTLKAVRRWLCKPLGDVEIDLESLRALIPPESQEKVRCGLCGGDGQITCAVCNDAEEIRDACRSCDGGSNDCPKGCGEYKATLVVIGSLVYDAFILRDYLVVASGDKFRFVDSTVKPITPEIAASKGGGEPLVLGGHDWRVAIMPTRNPITDEMPRLSLPKAEAVAQ